MQNGELKGHKEVDTLRITLLGFSLISIIVLSISIFYVFLDFAATHGGLLSDNSDISVTMLDIFRKLLIVVLVLPQVISFVVWVSMPPFIKRWYNLQPLPPEYTYVHDLVQEIASKMGISPPEILYTQKEVANCFNLGRTERESTIVISKWLVDHLDPDELKAVLIHEMAHTRNRDVTLMAYFSAVRRVIYLLPLFFLLIPICIPLPFGSSPLWWLDAPELFAFLLVFFVYLTFGCILIVFGIQWFSRLREIAADAQVSLFIDKKILKRTLYRLACEQSIRMLFISSCLMMSGTKSGGGIFSTHPSLYERYINLNKMRFIVDTNKSPSLRFCFTTALSIFLFTIFISLPVSVPFMFIEWGTRVMWFSFLFSVVTAGLLFFYYPFFSMKYICIMIFLITAIGSGVYFGFMLQAYASSLIFPLPPQGVPPGATSAISIAVPERVDIIATLIYFLQQRVLFAILTFLITIFLRLTKELYKTSS